MLIEGVGNHEAADINTVVARLLKEIGNPEPPLSLETVREALRLDLKFYNTAEPSFVEELSHRIKVGTKQFFLRPGLIVEAVRKANISALWMPDTKRILIDEAVPEKKHRWIEAHEIGHSLIPWHREFMFGDDEFTLDPACHAVIEGEANYAAAQLLFLCGKFNIEARDCPLDFKNIKSLAKRYGNTITTSLWRVVQERNVDEAVFGLISCHPKHPDIGSGVEGEQIRHYVRSAAFRRQFPNIDHLMLFDIIRDQSSWSRRGTVVNCVYNLNDVNGDSYEFRIESFCNGYALLTYGVLTKKFEHILSAA